jgi:hypothetical protein
VGSLKPLQDVAPRLAGLAVALELRQRLVQQPLLLRSRAKPIQEITLLKFAESLEDLRSFFSCELGQFGKDFGFAHGANLLLARRTGKHPLAADDLSVAETESSWRSAVPMASRADSIAASVSTGVSGRMA